MKKIIIIICFISCFISSCGIFTSYNEEEEYLIEFTKKIIDSSQSFMNIIESEKRIKMDSLYKRISRDSINFINRMKFLSLALKRNDYKFDYIMNYTMFGVGPAVSIVYVKYNNWFEKVLETQPFAFFFRRNPPRAYYKFYKIDGELYFINLMNTVTFPEHKYYRGYNHYYYYYGLPK